MLQLRLKPDQVEQREQAEAAIQEIKTDLAQEEDPEKQEGFKAELVTREQKLESLLDGFQVALSPGLAPSPCELGLTVASIYCPCWQSTSGVACVLDACSIQSHNRLSACILLGCCHPAAKRRIHSILCALCRPLYSLQALPQNNLTLIYPGGHAVFACRRSWPSSRQRVGRDCDPQTAGASWRRS